MKLKNVTLEMSLKPFKDNSEQTARDVCRRLFQQWSALTRHADMISVMLWTADGSEILDYKGKPDDKFDWARYIGLANPRRNTSGDGKGLALHSRPYLYMENPPTRTYGWLKLLVGIIKDVGREVTGKPIRAGATFDPGGEFARSSFKYEKHPEICLGETMGQNTFVCCYATLHADREAYAGFPDGIPEGTPFGTFFGRQCKHFLADLGFDYVWFSNGFGFGLETWGLRGAVFDGETFSSERCEEVRDKNLHFWDCFRKECPDVPVETRGTNLSTGMDLSSDAVPWREVYRGGYGIEPPPNSPWAAINGDFGLELVGWMSHIAEIPGDTFPFRFYTHDPWWLNSPWLDRYGREPHDIYLPLSVARIDGDGEVRTPTAIEFLTADDSYGNMPDRVPNEVIPHILDAVENGPDQPGPLVWVYPFDEYHDMTYGRPSRIEEVFFGDWFMRGAVNNGLPLNTVVSTKSFASATEAQPGLFRGCVLVSPVPNAGSPWADALLGHVRGGGNALLYGPTTHAGDDVSRALNLKRAGPLAGEFKLSLDFDEDMLPDWNPSAPLVHHGLLSAGGMCEVLADADDEYTVQYAVASQNREERIAALARCDAGWQGGRIAWVRGTVSCDPDKMAGHLLMPLDPAEASPGEMLMRLILQDFGYDLLVEKRDARQPNPMLTVCRHRNGFFLSGYAPNTTVTQHLRFPQGVPILLGLETRIEEGRAVHTMPRAWRRECRVFADGQSAGEVSCKERHSGMVGVKRRFMLSGLDNATVRFFHEPGSEKSAKMLRNPKPPFLEGDFVEFTSEDNAYGSHLVAENITGDLLISW